MTTKPAVLALAVVLFAASPVAADEVAPPARAAAVERADLEVGGRRIHTFRASRDGYTAAERAEGARERLIAAYRRNPNLALSTRETPEGTQVLADDTVMFIVRPDDVNTLGGDSPQAAAARAVEAGRQVVAELAERRAPFTLALGVGRALLVSLLCLLVLRLVFKLDDRLGRWAERASVERAGRLQLSGVALLDPALLPRLVRNLVRFLVWLLAAAVVVAWLGGVLRSLPFTRPWGDELSGIVLGAVAEVGRAALDSLPGLAFVAVIAVFARLVTASAGFFFDRVATTDAQIGWLDRDTARPTRTLFNSLVWLFALAMAYPYLPGAHSQAFQGLSVLVGLMVSIGASSTVSHAASGLILMYSRSFRPGDYVRIQAAEGTVTEMGLFVTRVRTGLGDEVILPNSVVLGEVSRNYSRAVPGGGFVLDTSVTIGYDTAWRQVHAMLIEAARRTPGITEQPAPRVFQTALSDFYVEYRLAAHALPTGPLSRAEALGRLHANIQDVFNEHGVQIMSPHYLGDPAQAKTVPPDRWYPAPARRE